MKSATKTRTQRRMERKQVFFLVVLLLVVSLASFTLGVMVGSRGSEAELARQVADRPAEPAAAAPPAKVKAPPKPTAALPSKSPADTIAETKLTFYDKLAKESAPLGSGINLPPEEEVKPRPVARPPIELPERPVVKKEPTVAAAAPPASSAAPVSTSPAPSQPPASSQGKYALQVASFAKAADAGRLKSKLVSKGYPAFVVEADLAAKGIWYRVKIGPYADSQAVAEMQQLMEKKEQLKGFVTRL